MYFSSSNDHRKQSQQQRSGLILDLLADGHLHAVEYYDDAMERGVTDSLPHGVCGGIASCLLNLSNEAGLIHVITVVSLHTGEVHNPVGDALARGRGTHRP